MSAIGSLFIPTFIAVMVVFLLASVAEMVMEGLWKRVSSND